MLTEHISSCSSTGESVLIMQHYGFVGDCVIRVAQRWHITMLVHHYPFPLHVVYELTYLLYRLGLGYANVDTQMLWEEQENDNRFYL